VLSSGVIAEMRGRVNTDRLKLAHSLLKISDGQNGSGVGAVAYVENSEKGSGTQLELKKDLH
jgi:hypothetical protein